MRGRFRRTKRLLFRIAVRLLQVPACRLPRPAALAFFAAVGDLVGRIDRPAAARSRDNLRRAGFGAPGAPDPEAVSREMFRAAGRNVVDLLRMSRLRPVDLERIVRFDGIEHLDAALARGRGVVALSGHFGNWEILGAALAARGYPLTVVASRLFDERSDRLLTRWREACGIRVVTRASGRFGAVTALRRGGILGTLVDQDARGPSLFADFFGHPAKTQRLPFLLARRTGAAMVPIWIRMDRDGVHRVTVRPAIAPSGAADPEKALREDAEAWHRVLERAIREAPAQWVWHHRRWKSRPPVPGPPAEASPVEGEDAGGAREDAGRADRRGAATRMGGMAGLSAVVMLAAALGGCADEPTSTPRDRTPSPQNEGMRGVRMQNIRVSDTRWVLTADSAAVYRQKKRVEAIPVQVDFFEEDRHVSVLTADLGILLQSTDDLEARGNVRVVSDEGTVLKTEVLFWDHQRSLIHTDEFVRIESGADVLTGVGMEADPGLDRVDIKRSVRGSVRDPESLLGKDGAAP